MKNSLISSSSMSNVNENHFLMAQVKTIDAMKDLPSVLISQLEKDEQIEKDKQLEKLNQGN